MRRVVVTGGAGFLGSHLCERLIEMDNDVVCLDNFFTGTRQNVEHLLDCPRFELVQHDVNQPITLEVDEIFHLACPASPIHYQRNPVHTIRTAVHGTLNMLDMAREVRAKILIASTSEIYGDPLEHPQTEAYWGHVNPVGPRACYDEGKRCAEALTVSYARQYDIEARIARIFNTYGPRMQPDDGRVVSNFVVQALRGAPITIYGDGSQSRSFCFVSDLVDGLTRLMASTEVPGPINLGNPHEQTIGELAELIVRLTGSASDLRYEDLPTDDPVRRRPDIRNARKVLSWFPKVSIEDGLRSTIDYFRRVLSVPSSTNRGASQGEPRRS
jgi:UDP-glucuronate decarboxylase